ncbi:MAG: cation diffusion facilitator family transporter [Christensenellales bacterium]
MASMQKDEGVKTITFCLVGNLFLLLLKGTVGLIVGSSALKADAVNSAGDVMSSFVVLLGLRYAIKPRDEDHHYGHGKMEALVSLVVGIMILISIGFLLRDIVLAIINKSPVPPSLFALVAALLSVIVKIIMFKKTNAAGKRLASIAIVTNAKDHKNDIFATSGAILSIALALVGQHFRISFLLLYSEPVIAAVISIFIVKTAAEIITEASKMLLDAAPEKEVVSSIREITVRTAGVSKLDWVKCRKMGRGLLTDVAIEVNGHISVEEGHAIGDEVKSAIMFEFPDVIDVLVHINPNEK